MAPPGRTQCRAGRRQPLSFALRPCYRRHDARQQSRSGVSTEANFLAGIDLWKTWAEIRYPMLVLRGAESDVLSHETLMRMQALRPGVEVLELPGISHAPALMSYDQIAAIREFLLR